MYSGTGQIVGVTTKNVGDVMHLGSRKNSKNPGYSNWVGKNRKTGKACVAVCAKIVGDYFILPGLTVCVYVRQNACMSVSKVREHVEMFDWEELWGPEAT